ncbi:hypothetical protein EOM57_03155 [Candidatus Saccharibacteria bacterium]|nr:hypothetical protein [Candidatus Saccharibacteria bacterium]
MRSKKLIITLVLITVFGFIAFFGYQIINNKINDNPTADSVNDSTDRSISGSGNDSDTSVSIPDSVDPSSIKPYTTIIDTETFKIRELDGSYIITLYAIINRPDQSDQYYDQLKQYKQDSLDYLSKQGVDVNKVKIQYEPEEATNL